jgi:hypothetical protein
MQISPYVSDRKRKRRQRRKYLYIALGIIALCFVLFAVQWFIFHSPFFRVDKVVVEGNNSVSSADIISLVQASVLSNHPIFPAIFGFNNMLLWPDTVSPNELNIIPQLEDLSISKDYFSHTVTVDVSERIPFGIWCFTSTSDCYWFDNTGTIFERAVTTQGNVIFVVQDHSQAERGLNQKVLPDEFTDNFISILDLLRRSDLNVKEIDLNDLSLEEVDVVTTNGPTIYFSLRFPADDYLGVIQKLMTQSNFDTLQYIDCRTEDRVYYK